LSISSDTLDRLIGSKKLTARRVGRRVLLQHTELLRFSRKDTAEI
jgi:excisionase family DNA binding protein